MLRCVAVVLGATLLLLLWAPGSVCGRKDAADKAVPLDPDPSVPRLTNATLQLHLDAVATTGREVVFTTTSAWTPVITDMLKHFMWHLHHVGRDRNLMIISQDAGTCRNLVAMGMPCYLDDMSPRGGDFPAGHRYGQRPWDFGKIYWALTLAELGYTSLYLDNDVACMDDPLPADILSAPYDLQGLSDFRDAELRKLGEVLDNRCSLYRTKFHEDVPGGDVLHPAWEIPKNETSMRALAPCQSLGAFYTKPSLATLQFYRYLSHWMIQTHPHQWDQAAWNEVVMAFLIGMGDEPALKYRILPVNRFMNIEVLLKRQEAKLAVHQVLVHAGYLNTDDKRKAFEKLGTWHAGDWDPKMGNAGLKARRDACGGSFLRCTGPRSRRGLAIRVLGLLLTGVVMLFMVRRLVRRLGRSTAPSGVSSSRLPFGHARSTTAR
mmetsp:Transcript_1768/g.5121  ORF Transcript_1768/g.5121 Transcript_1768/m.5121 type:complete len:434 (+) Transcript_1768:363-1664(+)